MGGRHFHLLFLDIRTKDRGFSRSRSFLRFLSLPPILLHFSRPQTVEISIC